MTASFAMVPFSWMATPPSTTYSSVVKTRLSFREFNADDWQVIPFSFAKSYIKRAILCCLIEINLCNWALTLITLSSSTDGVLRSGHVGAAHVACWTQTIVFWPDCI